ncbi:hypothetical protein P3T43_003647 [Paraburkholderia sp. GAS41]|jgi:hypothetical protein
MLERLEPTSWLTRRPVEYSQSNTKRRRCAASISRHTTTRLRLQWCARGSTWFLPKQVVPRWMRAETVMPERLRNHGLHRVCTSAAAYEWCGTNHRPRAEAGANPAGRPRPDLRSSSLICGSGAGNARRVRIACVIALACSIRSAAGCVKSMARSSWSCARATASSWRRIRPTMPPADRPSRTLPDR